MIFILLDPCCKQLPALMCFYLDALLKSRPHLSVRRDTDERTND
jgi:hypothetical protein